MTLNEKKTQTYRSLPNRSVQNNPFRKHTFVSYGVIPFCLTTKRWLMVKRRYSPEFMSFVRGFYYKHQIEDIVKCLSKEELLLCTQILSDDVVHLEYYNELSKKKDFEHSRIMAELNKDFFIEVFKKHNGNEFNNWLFPKGRMENGEEPMASALREFSEESGYPSKQLVIVNNHPIICTSQSYNGFNFETRYWVGVFRNIPEHGNIKDVKEISLCDWVQEDFVKEHPVMSSCLNEAKRYINKSTN